MLRGFTMFRYGTRDNARGKPVETLVSAGFKTRRAIIALANAMVGQYHSNMHANVDEAKRERTRLAGDICNVPCFKQDLVARLRAGMPAEEQLEEARVMFAALADRTRLRILHALRNGEELCVCDVAHVLGMSVSAASHHLRKLRDLKVLKYRTDKKMAYYSLRDRFVADLVQQALRQAAGR